ncbi:hypothetical protein COOONC_22597 [Cooperia oncophora]
MNVMHAVQRACARVKHYCPPFVFRIANRFEKLAPKRILMWTKVFREEKKVDFSDCKGFSDRCIATYNKSLISAADAVVFHAADIADGPLPEAEDRLPHQRYVFMSMETPLNSGLHAVPCNFSIEETLCCRQMLFINMSGIFPPPNVARRKWAQSFHRSLLRALFTAFICVTTHYSIQPAKM